MYQLLESSYHSWISPTLDSTEKNDERLKSSEILYKTQNYHLCMPSSFDELIDIFKFRYSVFKVSAFDDVELDFDNYDRYCDHLVVKDIETGSIVGVYRFLSSTTKKKYYSSTEFDLNDFEKLDGNKLELGRACVSEGHRNGQVIDLLWKGIGYLATKYNSRYLFGCSSLMSLNANDAANTFQLIKDKKYFRDDINVVPLERYQTVLPEATDSNEGVIPSLLKSYILAGAHIAGTPAVDRDFGCFDFFTVLDLSVVHSSFKKRYFSELML